MSPLFSLNPWSVETNSMMCKKIAFFIAQHHGSGVPLAQMRLAKALHRRGYSIEFIIGYVPTDLSVPVMEGIKVVNLNVSRAYRMFLPIYSYIRRAKPDVIFSAEDHLNAIVAIAAILAQSKVKLSASSRITPYRVYSNRLFSKKWFLKWFSIFLRKRIDSLVCVSEDMVKEYQVIFGSSKYQCIYNVICDTEMRQRMDEPVDDPWFSDGNIPVVISAGTLSGRKGFSDLILAMKILTARVPARLVILGEGPRRADLELLIENCGLTECVRLPGFQQNPLKYFSRSRVFVLSSYAEGLPNVLVEAMACGCTPVATDCPTGPREVLRDGQVGHLIPMRDPEAMARAIELALQRPMSKASLEEAVEPFTEARVVEKHRSVLGI